jgi:hypothetical protein
MFHTELNIYLSDLFIWDYQFQVVGMDLHVQVVGSARVFLISIDMHLKYLYPIYV